MADQACAIVLAVQRQIGPMARMANSSKRLRTVTLHHQRYRRAALAAGMVGLLTGIALATIGAPNDPMSFAHWRNYIPALLQIVAFAAIAWACVRWIGWFHLRGRWYE